jgi:hypothetical protein
LTSINKLKISDFSACGINIDPTRIAQSTEKSTWPWIGSLGSLSNGSWTHYCGVSLINETAVITAAHCVKMEAPVLKRLFYLDILLRLG